MRILSFGNLHSNGADFALDELVRVIEGLLELQLAKHAWSLIA